MEKQGEWIDCVIDNYEINTEYPHRIRRKSDKKLISEWIDESKNNNYMKIYLNKRNWYKHKVIALQFIENDDPENKTQVDHIDHDRTNNHISNLRWVSQFENMRNRKSYGKNKRAVEYIDQLPEDVIDIKFYNSIEFENYYYSPKENKFYYDNGAKYRLVPIHTTKNGFDYICARDIENHNRSIYISKWKRDAGIV